MLRVLRTEGAFRDWPEPNLIAMNGSRCQLPGGRRISCARSSEWRHWRQLGITIVWKEYGVRLNFKPTIIDEDHIRLELEPEVSTIDFTNGVKFNGFVVPALRTRRAKTGIELRDGQSFALAGLLDNTETKSLSRIPVVSDIPVLGALFKSKSFEKKETELMFIVTAQMVKPVNRDDLPQMRGIDGLKGNSPLGLEPKGEGIQGQTGYKISGQNVETPQATEPVKASEPAPKTTTQSDTETFRNEWLRSSRSPEG